MYAGPDHGEAKLISALLWKTRQLVELSISRLMTSARALLHCTRLLVGIQPRYCRGNRLQQWGMRQKLLVSYYTVQTLVSCYKQCWHPFVGEAPLNVLLALDVYRNFKDAAILTCVSSLPLQPGDNTPLYSMPALFKAASLCMLNVQKYAQCIAVIS